MSDFLSTLGVRVLSCDGAMGTQLLLRGLKNEECGMLWNVERAEAVRDIHRAYRQAGCDLITTNSFGGTTCVLDGHGLAGRMAELNRAAATNAREVAGDAAFVLGDIGPFGDFLEPLGDMSAETLRDIFRDQAAALVEGGVDALLVETMVDPEEMRVAISAAKDAAKLPVIATYSFNKTGDAEFRTMMGTSVQEAVAAALGAGADVVGTNCGTELSFADYLELARQLVSAAGNAPVIVQPNAGSPQFVDGQTLYLATPEEMGAIVQPFLNVGVRILGGCCGTTPDHLAAICRALSN